jgi:acyl-coenzyme A thioesterase PaaI-like protein
MKTIRSVQLFRKEIRHNTLKKRLCSSSSASRSGRGEEDRPPPSALCGEDKQALCALAETSNAFAREVLRPKVSEVSVGRLTMRMPPSPQLTGNWSTPCLHGGVAAALIDQCAGYCAKTVLENSNDRVSTVTFRLDYLAPAPCFEDTFCDAEVISKTESLVMVAADCWNHDRTKRLVSARVWFNIYRAK